MAGSAKLRQPTGQRISNVRKQQKKINSANLIFMYHQIWIPNNLGFMVLILMYIIPVIEFQAWEYKITNNHEQIYKKHSEIEKSCANKIFFTMYILIKSKCLKSNIVYFYALCRAILAVIDHLRYECFCATANKTKVWLM